MAGKLYDENSIQSIDPREFTRLRPGTYVGSTEYSTQLLYEILANAIDEHKAGHGNKIWINIYNDQIRVRDYGQGFLVNKIREEDGKTILEAAFSVLNTSAKYNDDGVYEGVALGLNGIGSKLVCYLSNWLDVTTFRDGECEQVIFEEGLFKERNIGKTDQPNGTEVSWKPSKEFFTNTAVDLAAVKKFLAVVVCLCPGLEIELNLSDEWEPIRFYSPNGINDLVDQAVEGKEILKNRLAINFSDNKNKLDLVLTYTDSYSSTLVPYVNTGLTESGPHITQIKTLITREMNKFFREKGWLKDKDENLSGEDCQSGLYLVFNLTAPGVAYDAQTKSRIVKLDMKPFTATIAEELEFWLAANEKDVKKIADRAINERKAREAARKAREAARGNTPNKKNKFRVTDSKLADCSSTDRMKCELYVVEGDSASGNLKKVRDKKYQAVLPLRGKILNILKANWDKIQKNAEIASMISAWGFSVDPATMKIDFKPELLRYGKIIIMSDADVDGNHIKNLFYTAVWRVCPELILNGYIYAGIPPLYRITMKKKYTYLKDDNALIAFREAHKGEKYEVNRLKGLGEMSPDETEECLVNPENRILKQVTVSDIDAANKLFEDLMGTSVTNRKAYVLEHAKEAEYGI